MQSVLIISVCALTVTVSPANNWPLEGTNNFRNLLLQVNRPVRQGGPFPQNPSAYPTNNVNGYGSIPYINGANSQQNQLPNLPVNNIQWVPLLSPNNAYPFLQPPLKNQNNPDFQRALNNFVSVQANNVNGAPNKPYAQQKYSQPGLIQAVEKKSTRSNPSYVSGIPQNQPQYITYATPQLNGNGGPQLNGNGGPQQPVQVASFNMKQAFPQVNTQNAIPQFIELDFNPKNPFSQNQENKAVKQNQFPRGANGQTNGYGTVQPLINFDINFNTPYPQNHPPVTPNNNQQYSQAPQSQLTPPKIIPSGIPTLPNIDFDLSNPFVSKNYREDVVHEPVHQPPDTFYDTEETPPVERLEHEKAPETNHEDPPEVPTRPIYPGQGKWAKFGVKHRPHISPHPPNYVTLQETRGIPEGYDTFLEGQKLFDYQNNQFGKRLQEFPQKHRLGAALPVDDPAPFYEQPQVQRHQVQRGNDEESEENEEDAFVPSRLYAQVRHTEDEKHLPPAADENGRLKELLKDSKVHTIYSEEGYEDLAYDHAGHEKKAENAEGYEKDKKGVVDDKADKKRVEIPTREVKTFGDKKPLKEEEFQELKEEALRFDDEDEEDEDDSDTEATEYDKSIISKVKPPKKVYSAKTKDASKYKVKVDDIMEGRGSSPISTIVKGDGNTEIEISSEVKVIVQPNNTTKSHKYVKIYPKYRKTFKNADDSEDHKPIKVEINKNLEIIEPTATDTPYTTLTPSIEEIFTVEMPATTQATTAIPKMKSSAPYKISKRTKREVDEKFPEIEVDTDFIDKINHTLPPTIDRETQIRAKFPYYLDFKQVGLDESSALRYSEDLKKAPPKTKAKFAFYKQADMKKACSEVNPIVDPVPERIKNTDENPESEETSDVADIAETPRLGQLGDKIDCFKAKYFGENPLDNPLFEEQSVGRVEPIFEEIDKMVKKQASNPVKRETTSKKLKYKNSKRAISDNDSEDDKNKDDNEETSETWEENNDDKEDEESIPNKHAKEIENNYITESTNPKGDTETFDVTENEIIKVATSAPPTLITTPKYTIDLQPKHIYDQIELLEYLPVDEDDTTTEKPLPQKPKEPSDLKKKLNKAKSWIKEKTYHLNKITEKNLDEAINNTSNDAKQRPSDKTKIFERYSLFDDEEEEPTEAPKSNDHTEDTVVKDDQNLEKLSEKGTETTLTFGPRGTNSKLEISNKVTKIRKRIKTKLDGAPSKAKAEGVTEKRRGRTFKDRGVIKNVEVAVETLPEPEPLKRHRRLRKRSRFPFIFDINPYIPKIPVAKPPFVDIILTPRPSYLQVDIPDIPEASFEIFDINKYLPNAETIGSETNVQPEYRVMSEVFYKDDIKPDEQLNVFNDVINNIKNSPYQHDMYNAASEQVAVKVKPDSFGIKDTDNKDKAWKGTNLGPPRYRSPYKNHKQPDLENSHINKQIDNKKINITPKNRLKLRRTTTTTEPDLLYNVYKNHKTLDYKAQTEEDSDRFKPVSETSEESKTKEKISPTASDSLMEDEDTDEDSTEVVGLVPPDIHGYKTISNTKRDNSDDTANEGSVEQKKLNKFIVPGMKPPPKRRVYSYSDYLTVNHIRQKPSNRKRNKRSAARPAYAEVTRNKSGPQDTEKNETNKEDDDYVPQRSRNYHYDEQTGKIIYDKKPETLEDTEEIEYIEVIDETPPSITSKPKQNPIFATATPPPPGQSYVDFVKLVKSASNYREIPDPTTTEKGQEASTTESVSSTTIKPVSTTPPEFISILAKVRNDSNYKVIEEKKSQKTTTTQSPTDEHVDDTLDVESQVQPVKNSPGSMGMGIVHGQMLKLFDITDFLPKVKNYMPKTIIDTSKYKTIQRPTLRHNLSSRYNSEEDKDLSNINTSKKPLLSSDERVGETKETSIEKIISPTIASVVKNVRRGTPFSTTTVRPQASISPKINRGIRRRVTTAKTTTTTQDTTSPELNRSRRTHRRRNLRGKPAITATTTQIPKASDTPKVILRRSQRDSTTLSSENKEQNLLPVNYNQPRSQEITTSKAADGISDNDTVEVAQKVVNIFKNYERQRRRGGNNKEGDEVVASENRLGQSQGNRIAPQDGDVDVFKNYDKTKKHGGNYRAENEDNAQITENQATRDTDVFKNYDQTKKHGGNYREENESDESKPAIVEESENEKTNDVEAFKDYDRTKKHGGNYRSEDEAQQLSEPQYEESRVLTPKGNQIDPNGGKTKDTEVFKDYDKTKKHGGNYVSEEEAKRIANAQANAKDIEIFNNYDKTKKHGGNYRAEHESVIDPENEESAYEGLDPEQKLRKRNNESKDPVLGFNPETFYTDPKLPVVINGLKIIDNLSHEELEQIVADPEAGSFSVESVESSEIERKDSQNVIGRDDKIIVPERTTKKPLFIKDPSQRLYFYAPLR